MFRWLMVLVMLIAWPALAESDSWTCRKDCEKPAMPCFQACYSGKGRTDKQMNACVEACDKKQMPCYEKCALLLKEEKARAKKK